MICTQIMEYYISCKALILCDILMKKFQTQLSQVPAKHALPQAYSPCL